MSYPQAVRFSQLMSYSIRQMSAEMSAGQSKRIIVVFLPHDIEAAERCCFVCSDTETVISL